MQAGVCLSRCVDDLTFMNMWMHRCVDKGSIADLEM